MDAASFVISWGCTRNGGSVHKIATRAKPPHAPAVVLVDCPCGEVHRVACIYRPRRRGESVTEIEAVRRPPARRRYARARTHCAATVKPKVRSLHEC